MKKVMGVLSVLFLFVVSQGFFVLATNAGGSDSAAFTMSGYSCESTNTSSSWVNFSGGSSQRYLVYDNGVDKGTSCLKYAVENGNESCCPKNYGCVLNSTNSPVCKDDTLCSSFKNSETCGNASELVAKITLRGNSDFDSIIMGDESYLGANGAFCVNHTSVKCYWDLTNQSCGFQISQTVLGNETCQNWGNTSTCTYKLKGKPVNKCEESDGAIVVDYTATSGGAGLLPCEDKTLKYPCGSSVVLPFFTRSNFLISLLGIFLAYFLYNRKSY